MYMSYIHTHACLVKAMSLYQHPSHLAQSTNHMGITLNNSFNYVFQIFPMASGLNTSVEIEILNPAS